MGQEFIIKSQKLEDKVNQLLPSQGGFQAGVDLSASTTVIPIVDLTETAEGSYVQESLQQAFSLNTVTRTTVNNTTTTLVNTTGYYRVFGTCNNTGTASCLFSLTDGVTTKFILQFVGITGGSTDQFDFVVALAAGHSLVAQSGAATANISVVTRQIADINGNLIQPL